MLQSLTIENFRGFGKLELPNLAGVNLIVGKNNAGKTSLLEAVVLLANDSKIQGMPGLFRATAGSGDHCRWLIRDGAERSEATIEGIEPTGERRSLLITPRSDTAPASSKGLVKAFDGDCSVWRSEFARLRIHIVSVQHREPDSIVESFAEAVRSPEREQQLLALLAGVDPRVRAVRLDVVRSAPPFVAVDLGLPTRLPLPQAGQGIYRLVAIFSELLGSGAEVCVIDELENGIHYTALPHMWSGLADAAARLSTQIFVTTHSRECLVAAHEAFSARERYDFRVIQLYRMGDTVSGRVLDREHIEAAIKSDIEVR